MKPPNLKPLNPAMSDLLDFERSAPEVPRALRDEGWARVSSALTGGALAGAAPVAKGVAAKNVMARVVGAAAIAFGIGAVLGALLHARLTEPLVVYRDRPASSAAEASEPPVAPAPAAPSASIPAVPSLALAPAPRASSPAAGSRGDLLALERTLLDRARSALAGGNTSGARAALAEHQRTFPRGALTEEREFLAIECALREGRATEAHDRAARFRARFPSSAFGPAIDESMGAANP